MQPDPAARRGAIEKALLDYHRTPGKYALARRQPSLLYVGIKDVLQLASGRAAEGGGPPPSPQVQQAACFFIRSALLFPDADHYALLGLDHDATAGAIKDRYRLMMRLMHPDFAATVQGAPWPADCATRLNRAYEVLSSPVARATYDKSIDVPASRPQSTEVQATPGRAAPAAAAAGPRRRPEDNRRDLKRLSAVFGAVGGIALVSAGIAALQPDRESLVQRETAAPKPGAARARLNAALPTAAPSQREADPATVPALQSESMLSSAIGMLRTDLARAPSPQLPAPQVVQALARPAPAATPPLAPAPPAAVASPARATQAAPAPLATAAPPLVSPEPAAAPVAAAAVVAAAVVVAPVSIAPPAVAPTPAPRPAPYDGPTLADVHPLLSRLLQEIESGWGDRMMALVVDREARAAPAGQALLMHYNNLVGGTRPVKVSNVQFNAQPQGSRLLVTGRLLMQPQDKAAAPREFALQAEFAARDGGVAMTRLTRAPD